MHSHPALLTCRGWRLGNCYVPSFEVRAGELVRIQFPNRADVPRDEFQQALCSAGDCSAVQSTGIVIANECPVPRSRWRQIFHEQRAGEWFRERTGVSLAVSQSYLERVGLDPNTPLCHLAGNPRKLLAIQAAHALHCDVLIFDTDGIDPLGMRSVLKAVVDQLGDSAAIYLASGYDRHEPEVAYSAVINVDCGPPELRIRPHVSPNNQATSSS